MSLSYRTRRRLRGWTTALLTLLILGILAFTTWVVWADRYVIYTRDGARLDFSLEEHFPAGEPAKPQELGDPVEVVVILPQEGSSQAAPTQTSINGYYVDSKLLEEDIPGLMETLKTLPEGTAVLMDMKTVKGSFYYETTVGSTVESKVDQEQMSQLLQLLSSQNLHAIARIPAFRDWEFGLNNVPLGLPKKGGNGSLWMDSRNCYWLNPTKDGVLEYLIEIAMELKSLGFKEVVFTDFRFPDTDKITFKGDKTQALTDAAATLAAACATERFTVSFYTGDYQFELPAGNTRLYITDAQASELPLILQTYPTGNPSLQLLFLTEAHDTRFNDYCVLRPLEDAA